MAVWQITKNNAPTGENFDDGQPENPWDEGFSTDAVKAHADSLGANHGYNYVGQSPTA